MAETAATPTKPTTTRGSAADTRIIAQIEKWMAVIREIKQERATN